MRSSIHASNSLNRRIYGKAGPAMSDFERTDFRELPVWQAAMALVQAVYRVTEGLPLEEGSSVAGQLRGVSIMVPGKIANGIGTGDPKLLLHNLSLAYGAISELRTLCYVARDMGDIDAESADQLALEAVRIGRMIHQMTDNLPAIHPGSNGHGDFELPAVDD
jgi:four helix bundle protein